MIISVKMVSLTCQTVFRAAQHCRCIEAGGPELDILVPEGAIRLLTTHPNKHTALPHLSCQSAADS